MFRVMLAAITGLAVAGAPAVAQEMYQWTDEQGRRHISNVPPPGSDSEHADATEDPEPAPDRGDAADRFATSVDAVLGSLEASIIRKERVLKRERLAAERLREKAYDLQGEIRAGPSGLDDSRSLPPLPGTLKRLSDEQERHERKIATLEAEIEELELKIEELRNVKLSGRGDLESADEFDR